MPLQHDRDSVLFVSGVNGFGGPCQSLAALLAHVSGFVRIVAPSRSDSPTRIEELADELIVIHRPRGLRIPHAQAQLCWAAQRFRSSLAAVHANGLTELAVAAPAAALLRLPVVVWTHNYEVPRVARLIRPFIRQARIEVRWTAVSEYARQMVHDAKLADVADIQLVPNPIEPSTSPAPAVRKGPPVTIGYFAGSDRHVKGFDLLPECITALLDEPVHWVIYTSPAFTTNASAWQKLLALPSDRVSIRSRVTDVAGAYAATDVVFVPSRRESFCRVAAEAMAHGLPVVASDLPPLHEVLGEDEAGLFFPIDDPAAAAVRLRKLIHDPLLRERLGARGRERALAYHPSATLRTFTEAYASLAQR